MKFKLLFILLLSGVFSFGQSYTNESKLIEFLGQERFTKLHDANSSYLKFLDARLSYGFQLVDYVPEKMSSFPVVETIEKINADKTTSSIAAADFVDLALSGNINYLMYKLDWDQSTHTYYRLGNTGKVLVILPNDMITQKVNNQ